MKNILIGAAALVVVGGGAYALMQREQLKQYFQTGDVPSQEEFADTIDSTVHMQEDRDMLGLKEQNPTKDYAAGDTVVKSEPILQAKVVKEGTTQFSLDAIQPVTFRWTPVTPKPKEPVTYRLKVWQLMQGQNGAAAMRSNKPIVTKDVVDASEVTVSGIYTGPCRPPYLCDFVWSVEMMSHASTDTGAAAGTMQGATDGTGSGAQVR